MERWGTGIAGERPAWFPTLDPKAGGLVTLAQQAFGYGCMVPPLYTCALYNAIANDGKFVKPRLMQALRMADGTDSLLKVSYVRDSICSPANARIIREMLYGVVNLKPGGTAWRLKGKDDPLTSPARPALRRLPANATRAIPRFRWPRGTYKEPTDCRSAASSPTRSPNTPSWYWCRIQSPATAHGAPADVCSRTLP